MTPFDKAMQEAAVDEAQFCYCAGPTCSGCEYNTKKIFTLGAQWATKYWQNLGEGEFNEAEVINNSMPHGDREAAAWVYSLEDAKKVHDKNAATIAALRAENEKLIARENFHIKTQGDILSRSSVVVEELAKLREENELLQKRVRTLDSPLRCGKCGNKPVWNTQLPYLDTIEKLRAERDSAVECLNSIGNTDSSENAPDFLWLQNWRHETKQKAHACLARIEKG
jgi:BMFP domain-containing protein YqiC